MLAIKLSPLIQVICFVVTLVAATGSIGASGNAIQVSVPTDHAKTTVAPTHAPASAASTPAPPAKSTVTPHAKGSTNSPSTHSPVVIVKVPTVSSTVAPHAKGSTNSPSTHSPVVIVKVPTVSPIAVVASGQPVAAPASSSPAQKLTAYFEPICAQINKLKSKHTFKIQSQLKQFIEKTSGKMSACFMHHYAIDPNLSLITIPQLHIVCASRAHDTFKQFLDCAAKNWDTKLDSELDKISAARANCLKKHAHSKNDTTIHLEHDEDDKVLINDVVTKMLGDNHGKANVKLIDLEQKKGSSAASAAAGAHTGAAGAVAGAVAGAIAVAGANSKHTTAAPTGPIVVVSSTHAPKATKPSTTHAPSAKNASSTHAPSGVAISNHVPTKKLLNEPNASIVIVDNAKGKATVLAFKTTAKPAAAGATSTTAAPTTTAAPSTKKASTTSSPGTIISNTTVVVTVAPAPKGTASPSTIAPKGTTNHPVSLGDVKVSVTKTASKNSTTKTPSKVTKKPTKEPAKEEKLLKEIALKTIEKAKQVKEAVKSNHKDDQLLHKLEHERQMAKDPAGHLEKHRQYERSKVKGSAPGGTKKD